MNAWKVGEKSPETAANWHPVVALYEGCGSFGQIIAWALAGEGEGGADARAKESAERIVRAVNSYADMLAALKGVVRVADRKTVEFEAAHAAIAAAEGQPLPSTK